MTTSLVSPLASPGVVGSLWDTYLWLVVLGAIIAFFMAWGIGANDVANSFGTSVGAKTLTIFQACLVAAVFEFVGALALGGEVTRTIAGSIARPSYFYPAPEIFAYGMVCALTSASTWLYVATYLKLAVSTTHSIIGAVLGFALVYGGADAVVWNDKKDTFPYATGLVPIICSWFVSPLSAAIVSIFLFFTNRMFILRAHNSTIRAMWSFPVLLLITVFVNIFFVLYKGASKELAWTVDKAAWVAAIVAAGTGIVGGIIAVLWMKWRLKKDEQIEADLAAETAAKEAAKDVESTGDDSSATGTDTVPTTKTQKFFAKVKSAVMHGVNKDIHDMTQQDEKVQAMHASAEVFDPKTERIYQFLQVFSACCVAFSHGANDVANAIGPFAGIWAVYRSYVVSSNAATPIWVLALGGAGIVVGLWTFGYNIMMTLGVGMAKMTPSRGFCAELATSLVLVIASAYGLPVSSTQTIVGAELGIGLTENIRTGANFKLFFKQVLAWIFTLIVASLVSAAIFSWGCYAPSINMHSDLTRYENSIRGSINTMTAALNVTNFANNVTLGPSFFNRTLNNTIRWTRGNLSNWYNYQRVQGFLPANDLLTVLNNTIKAYRDNSVITVGFNSSLVQKTINYTMVAAPNVTAFPVPPFNFPA